MKSVAQVRSIKKTERRVNQIILVVGLVWLGFVIHYAVVVHSAI